jgi:hypothetical protein
VVVTVLLRGRAQMDDGVVPTEFDLEGRAEGRPELLQRSWPVGQGVDRSTITEHNGRIVAVPSDLQLALDIEDCPLRRASTGWVILPWETAAEHDAGSFWQDLHVRAE